VDARRVRYAVRQVEHHAQHVASDEVLHDPPRLRHAPLRRRRHEVRQQDRVAILLGEPRHLPADGREDLAARDGNDDAERAPVVRRVRREERATPLPAHDQARGTQILERVDQKLLDVDLLKVPHHGYATSSSVDFINAASPELAVSVGRLPIPARISNRYANLGVTFLDDRTKGYVEVVASSDGTMTYTTTRTEENDTTTPGDDTIETPDGSEED